mgnify:CR=1 FL=1
MGRPGRVGDRIHGTDNKIDELGRRVAPLPHRAAEAAIEPPGVVSGGLREERSMTEATTVSRTFAGTDKSMSFETGRMAGLAGGAVMAQIGRSTVLVTATGAKSPRPGADFFPLTVDIEERMYAAGKIPGSFFRREGRAPESAILTCRLIDRPLRPMFPDGFRNEVHIVGTVVGADMENPHDVLALNGASAALMLSGIPFDGPVGAVRIAWSAAGEWIPHHRINHTLSQVAQPPTFLSHQITNQPSNIRTYPTSDCEIIFLSHLRSPSKPKQCALEAIPHMLVNLSSNQKSKRVGGSSIFYWRK